MEKITAYKTTDGLILEEEQKAQEHEDMILLKSRIAKFVNIFLTGYMTEEQITKELTLHAKELRDALTHLRAFPELLNLKKNYEKGSKFRPGILF